MRIIVNNKAEQTLVEEFLEALHEELLGVIRDHEMTSLTEGEDPWLSDDSYDFLANAIYNAKVDVSDIEKPMYIESWNIYGTCSTCGAHTEGTIDGEDIDLEEYQRMMSPDSISTWKCETCFMKERED